MILHIGPQESESLFSDFCEDLGQYLDFECLDDFHPLKTVLARYRALPNYQFLFLQYDDRIPEQELLEAAAYLRAFHRCRVIVFAPKSPHTSQVFGKLIDLDIRELVQVDEDTDLFRSLEDCMSDDGMDFSSVVELQAMADVETARTYVRPELEIPKGFVLSVGIAGTQARVGVTTQAFSFYHALKHLGFQPCIIYTDQEFIGQLLSLYEDEAVAEGSVVSIQGMDFAAGIQIGTGHNAYLYDCGVLNRDNAKAFSACNLRFLCAGTKAWELPYLVQALAAFPNTAGHLLFSFSSDREEKEALELLDGILPASFAPYAPDIWHHGERLWHEELLVPMAKELLER